MNTIILVGMVVSGIYLVVLSFILNVRGTGSTIMAKVFPFLIGAFLIFSALVLSGNVVFTTTGSLL